MRTSLPRRRALGALLGAAAMATLGTGAARGAEPGSRRTFVLLHGSTHSAGGMAPLASALEQLGYAAACPELPYADPDATQASILDALRPQWQAIAGDGPISCVGHSITGLLLPLLHRHARVDSLVYLAAAIAKPGLTFRDHAREDGAMFCPPWIEKGHLAYEDEAISRHFLYHDVDAAHERLARRHRIKYAARSLWLQPTVPERHPDLHTAYLACTFDRVFEPAWMQRAAPALLGVEATALPFGHMPHLADPMAVARALVADLPETQRAPA
jgi:hypothetical protein